MKELKVGERLTITLEAVEQNGCEGCFFEEIDNCGASAIGLRLNCVSRFRSDGKNIIFKEVKG